MSQISHRLATAADRNFAEKTFVDSFRVEYYAGPLAPWDRLGWRTVALPQVRRVLSAPGVEVHVAFNPEHSAESEADIYGWLALRRARDVAALGPKRIVVAPGRLPLVIFTYVKLSYRGWGIARGLFKVAGIDPWEDVYEYACRTSALMEMPGPTSPHRRPMVERLTRARWNPRATRGGSRNGRPESSAQDRTRGGAGEDGGGQPGLSGMAGRGAGSLGRALDQGDDDQLE